MLRATVSSSSRAAMASLASASTASLPVARRTATTFLSSLARLPTLTPPTPLACRHYSASPPPPPSPPSIPPPLEGIRVLDLTRILAGPYCTMLLSDLGADVIKVENPKGGDDTRAWAPPGAESLPSESYPADLSAEERQRWASLPPESAYFLSVNRGKRSLTLDLKAPDAQAVVRRLIEQSDVVIENYLPHKLDKMGLGYEQVKAIKPDIVYASLTGYGQTGPYSDSPGYDVIIAADAGLMHITGEPDRPPVKIGVAMTDLTTGLYVHGAIMAALIGRGKTGKGVHIDASLFESQIASLANIASNYLVTGAEATRMGHAHPSIVPYQVFPTKDSSLMVGAGNDRQFGFLCDAIQQPDLAKDDRFASNGARVANRTHLIALLTDAFSAQTNDYWLARLEKKLPIAPVRNIQETFQHPQALARNVVSTVEHPRIGALKLTSPAVTYGAGKMPITRPPPVLGQHNKQVLKEMGYSEGEIRDLQQAGAVGLGGE